jgi:hypothetical protein
MAYVRPDRSKGGCAFLHESDSFSTYLSNHRFWSDSSRRRDAIHEQRSIRARRDRGPCPRYFRHLLQGAQIQLEPGDMTFSTGGQGEFAIASSVECSNSYVLSRGI